MTRRRPWVGLPHADFGETVLGVLLVQPGPAIDLEDVMASVRTALARFKHLRQLVIVEALPRNAMGKVQKNVLRDQFGDIFVTA